MNVHRLLLASLLMASLALLSTAVGARADILRPVDPVKQAAYDVLDTHCARCHQSERLEGRKTVAKNFDHILDLDSLAANVKYVQPGDPEKSLLLHTMVRQEMPYDVYQEADWERAAPHAADLDALRKWIKGLEAAKPDMIASQKTVVMAYASPAKPFEVKLIEGDLAKETPPVVQKAPIVATAPAAKLEPKVVPAPVRPKSKPKAQLPHNVIIGKPVGEFHPHVALRQPSPHAIVREKPSRAYSSGGGGSGGGSDTISGLNGI